MMTAEQLKGSIIQLAMQGKLVEQRTEEGTGEELYKRIINRKGGNSNLEEYPIDIPETWHWVKLNEVCDIYTGDSISENVKKNKYMRDIEGYPYIATKDVQFDNTVEYDNGVIIPFNEDFRHAYKGAVLMCIEGGSAGRKIALINRDVCFGNKLCMFYSLAVSNQYIYYYLQSPLFQSTFRNGITGIIGGVSIKKIKSMWLPLPSLGEQMRIVAKIEELMLLVEQYAAASTKLNMLNTTFPEMMKKSILQEAVQGKLVPQDPNDEPASLLLKKIAEENKRLIKEGKIKKQKPLPEIMEDEVPFDIPESWEWVRVGSYFNTSSGTTPSKSNNEYYDQKDINWVRTTDLNNGVLDKCEIQVSQKAYEECRLEIIPQDSVCIAMYGGGGTIGKNALIKFDTTINQSVCAIHPNGCNMKYIQLYMQHIRPRWMDFASGSRKDPNINQIIIKNCLIPIPPLKEQKRIVEIVTKLMDRIGQL